jgi:hypothetical protein
MGSTCELLTLLVGAQLAAVEVIHHPKTAPAPVAPVVMTVLVITAAPA